MHTHSPILTTPTLAPTYIANIYLIYYLTYYKRYIHIHIHHTPPPVSLPPFPFSSTLQQYSNLMRENRVENKLNYIDIEEGVLHI